METKIRRRSRRDVGAGRIPVLAVLLTLAGAAAAQTPALDDQHSPLPTFFGGIQVNEPDHDRWAQALVGAGLDTVQVTLYARQQRWNGPDLWYEREAPWVVSEIRAAHSAGLRVMLVMRVALEHGLVENRHLWHGMIWPEPGLLGEWFDNYTGFVLWGAELAAREGVELLVVGNELNSMSATVPLVSTPPLYAYWLDSDRVAAVRRRLVECAESVAAGPARADLEQLDGGRYPDLEAMLQAADRVHRDWAARVTVDGVAGLNARRRDLDRRWRGLIRRVREFYSGTMTYGANFDQYFEVGFWDELDALGVTGYFPLGRYGLEGVAARAQARQAWHEVAGRLTAASGGKPVIFTELGWTRRVGSTVRPYSYDRVEVLETAAGAPPLTCVHWASQPNDPKERLIALAALGDVVEAGEFAALRGFSLWKLTTRARHRAIEPFAVLVGGRSVYDTEGWESWPGVDSDRLDAAFIGVAARIADRVRRADRPPGE